MLQNRYFPSFQPPIISVHHYNCKGILMDQPYDHFYSPDTSSEIEKQRLYETSHWNSFNKS